MEPKKLLKIDDGATSSDAENGFIVVTQVGSQTFGIVVDGVFHTEEIVVKPMSTKLRHIDMFSGNTILGDGPVIMIGNFAGPGGTPFYLIQALRRQGAKNLTIVANTAGGIGLTLDYDGHRILFENKQVKKVIASFPFSTSASRPSVADKQILAGEVELEIVPQGTLSERIRAGGAGVPASALTKSSRPSTAASTEDAR